MKLASLYSEHRWWLQLVAWFVVMSVLAGLVVRQCRRAHEPLSAISADSLMRVDLPRCCRVDYIGFTIYFDAQAHLARCAVYELTSAETRGSVSRMGAFACDSSVAGCARPDAYAGSGMQRGHLVPAADLRWDTAAMRQSFLMTNICPQSQSLNEGGWSRLEEKIREWARRDGALIVATGPVMMSDTSRTATGVVVPDYYYKVVLAHRVSPMRAVAFVYPNRACGGSLSRYAVTVDSVERLTGIDFFSCLPSDQQVRLESRRDLSLFLRPFSRR